MFEDLKVIINILQVVGTAFAVMQVVLAKNNNVNNYLFGIISIGIGSWIHFHSLLYADLFLDTYYMIMSVYGWIYWKFGKKKTPTPITYSTKSDFLKTCSIIIICFSVLGYWMKNHTNSDVPIWDASTVAFAWGGMWLMAKRKVENWIFLNISNLIAIPLLIYKELYIYAGLTIFLFVLAILGYLKWKTIIKNQHEYE